MCHTVQSPRICSKPRAPAAEAVVAQDEVNQKRSPFLRDPLVSPLGVCKNALTQPRHRTTMARQLRHREGFATRHRALTASTLRSQRTCWW